jgi:hypothetical protein
VTTETKVEAVAWRVLEIGNRGAAYDPRDAKRAFTYDHQPGNIDASKLGRATVVASLASAGDSIDRGLSLLKALQAEGFGVFQVGQEAQSTITALEGEVERSVAYSAHLEEVVATRNLDWYTEKQRADAAARRVAELEGEVERLRELEAGRIDQARQLLDAGMRQAGVVRQAEARIERLMEALANAESAISSVFESGDYGMSDDTIEQGFAILEDIRGSVPEVKTWTSPAITKETP